MKEAIDFIPHHGLIVMIDRLILPNENIVETFYKIPKEHIFVSNHKLDVGGIIENMAQSAAAFCGLAAKDKMLTASIPMIAELKRLEVALLPMSGDLLHTRVERVAEYGEMILMHADIFVNDDLIATGEMKLHSKYI